MDIQAWHILLLLAVICLGLELVVGSFLLLSFSVAFAAVALANGRLNVDSVPTLALLFAISALISGYVLRRWLGSKLSRRSDVNEY